MSDRIADWKGQAILVEDVFQSRRDWNMIHHPWMCVGVIVISNELMLSRMPAHSSERQC